MIPLELPEVDEVRPVSGGLYEFVSTNVSASGGLTEEVLLRAAEFGLPTVFSREFEVGVPELMAGLW